MSNSSEVIPCCLNLLYSNCNLPNNFTALSLAICIAKMRAACSEVLFSTYILYIKARIIKGYSMANTCSHPGS